MAAGTCPCNSSRTARQSPALKFGGGPAGLFGVLSVVFSDIFSDILSVKEEGSIFWVAGSIFLLASSIFSGGRPQIFGGVRGEFSGEPGEFSGGGLSISWEGAARR